MSYHQNYHQQQRKKFSTDFDIHIHRFTIYFAYGVKYSIVYSILFGISAHLCHKNWFNVISLKSNFALQSGKYFIENLIFYYKNIVLLFLIIGYQSNVCSTMKIETNYR